ncbi:hypothetical protein [Spongiactinospora sp. TRM90649]|uniref:hypothetical protein n=1 Tax=Spongiactinospora sp. TRM90649 TaxID=3031114 RepID=UPI0023F61AFD|nr:hypothetical protein [Spongiactinospora sp. TRM90649]MDF5755726.1 hypothetical protein [Spongiactinospora sp. TRM90649]
MVATTARAVLRSADGARVTVDLPPAAGTLRWFGHTRMAGPRLLRAFDLAPVGQHAVIPKKILPGASPRVVTRRGHDLIVYEAADRSNSCLVWAGPYHEATTWFGGPAPRQDVLERITRSVRFRDAPEGANLGPRRGAGIRQYGTIVAGMSKHLIVTIRDAGSAKPGLPEWRGAPLGEAEVWKERLDLDPAHHAALRGTPFEWRYIYATCTAAYTVIFPAHPAAPNIRAQSAGDAVDAVLAGIRVRWEA